MPLRGGAPAASRPAHPVLRSGDAPSRARALTPDAPARADDDGALLRGIGRASMVALFVNAVVGAGIFGLPSRVHALLGSWAIAAYVACALLVLLVVLCFAEVGSRYARSGGPYLYAREAFGAVAGFQVGWLVWLTRVTAFAALCNLMLDYAAWFIPTLADGPVRIALVVATGVLLAWLNIRGVQLAALVGNGFTIAKLVPLLAFVAVGALFVEPARLQPPPPPPVADFAAAMLLLVFAFTGFETATVPAGEVREPRRTLPFAILAALAVIVPVYVGVQVVAAGVLPGLAQSTRPLADAADLVLGRASAAVMVCGAVVSIAGTLNGLVLAAPRLLYAMARDGQLPARLAATHPRRRTPHVAIALTALAMVLLTLAGSFLAAVAISTLTRLLVYLATCAAMPVLRRRGDAPPALFRAPGGAVTALAAIAVIAWLLSQAEARELLQVVLAMAAGGVLMLLARRGPPAAEA